MSNPKSTLQVIAVLVLATTGWAQGIVCKRSATVLYGSTTNCSQPATIDSKKVRAKTPEWRTIKSEGVQKGSARYALLIAEMTKRIKAAVNRVAESEGRDCVVHEGDIKNDNGLTVADLTEEVIDELDA